MYEKLFFPLQVGNLTLKNRITRAPMYLAYANEGGTGAVCKQWGKGQ